NGPQALSIANSSGAITFGGIVGGSSALASLLVGTGDETGINTTGITTSGAQTYSSTVTLGAVATLTGTGITLNTVAGGTHDLILADKGTTKLNRAKKGGAHFQK